MSATTITINTISKILLYPLALVYGSAVAFRNFLYDKKLWKAVQFDFPVIAVGNLTAGGSGKTPHVEYLIALLQYTYRVATLSRGYGRTSHGFLIASNTTTAAQVGDEPRQFKSKFPETIVSVGEDRVMAVPRVLNEHPEVDVILLDDAFQHRAIRPGLSILLTEFAVPFTRDHILPLGWLREAKANYHRADIIIVTKCPPHVTAAERSSMVEELKPYRYQKIYFSHIQYGELYSFYDAQLKLQLESNTDVLLVSGIARHNELKQYLASKARNVYSRTYRDHHRFDLYDLDSIRQTFSNLGDVSKVIVTTEKDAARLEQYRDWFLQNKIGIFVQPIKVVFNDLDGENFNTDILDYIETTKQKTTINGNG